MRTAARDGRSRPGRALVAAGAALGGLAVLAGCGIRGTTVPVDAGSAPSRATCVVQPHDAQPQPSAPSSSATTTVQLVCTSQLLPVTRQVTVPEGGDPLALARTLLAELKRQPTPAEEEAGFSTEVPQALAVNAPRRGDPAGTLRLSSEPDDLPAVALAQLVCTFAGTPAADGRSTVALGGPGEERPRGYACTDETRTRPESARGSGTTLP
ncbi:MULTISPECIES: hypothetical protein [Streptomyces]|uniref:Lipoprotein n=1 Tax=Streptomyces luteosporeus TaxID=173856 RepID=A0ABN3TJL7_9ACTN